MDAAARAIRQATFAELDTATLYAILALRVDVFVVEQRCAYHELDGLDRAPTTRHLWIAADTRGAHGAAAADGVVAAGAAAADGPVVAAYLRLLVPPRGPARIGRVVTAPAWRRHGLAAALIRAAVALVDVPVVLHAQAHLRQWYSRLGFVPCGEVFVEDGIAHVSMTALQR